MLISTEWDTGILTVCRAIYIQGRPPVALRFVGPKLLKICFHSEMYIRRGKNLKIILIIQGVSRK